MKIVNHEVIHKTFGKGTIIEQDNAILTVCFSRGEKRFQYPEAFRTFLQFSEDTLNIAIQEEICQLDRAKRDAITVQSSTPQSITKPQASKRSRDERPNIAFKCNYCDGGSSDKSVGFNGVCSDAVIYNNIDVEHRTWCCSEDCSCPRYLNGEITREELEEMCKDDGFICYESQMLRDWKAMAGIVQNGDRKGQPMHLNQVQPNSLCILTTRDPYSTEDQRYIFAAFLVDDTYGGDDLDEGFVTTRSEFRLQLSPEEAHKMLFWNYHANGKQPETAAWNSGLHRYMTDEQAAQILRDIASLKQMECFDSVEFLPVGIPGYKKIAEPELSGARSLVLVSPFLSDGVVKALTVSAKQTALITRKSSITPTVLSSFQDVFVTKELVLDNELLEEGELEETPQRDIHAKIFFEERDEGKYLYLGSLNASANAFYHNVEFVLKLRYRPYYASFTSVLGDLVPEEQSPFERIETMDELSETAEQEDPADLQDVVYAVKQAEVTANGELYTVHISCGALESPCEIALFGASSVYRNLAKEVVFEKVSLTALSEFYIVRRGNVSAIIKIPTVGIPAEERDSAIYSAIIGDRRGFFRYVSFLLSDNYAETSLEEQMLGMASANEASASAAVAGVYEQLLRTAAENPERLAAVENMMSRLNPEIVDERFRVLISTCRSAAKQVKRK